MDSHPSEVKRPSIYSWTPAALFLVLTVLTLNTDSEAMFAAICIVFATARGMYGFGFDRGQAFQKYHGDD